MDGTISFTTGLTLERHWQIEGWRGDRRLRVEFDPEAAQIVDHLPRHVLATAVEDSFAEKRATAVYRSWSDKFSHWLVAITKDDLREASAVEGSTAMDRD